MYPFFYIVSASFYIVSVSFYIVIDQVPTHIKDKNLKSKLYWSEHLTLSKQCSNLTVVHSSKTSKNCPKRVGFFATSPVDE